VLDDAAAGKGHDHVAVLDLLCCAVGNDLVGDGNLLPDKATLLLAHKQGKRFRVSIIDSRPLFEGKSLARDLANTMLLPAKVTITSPSWTFCAALSAMTWSATVIFSRISISQGNAIRALKLFIAGIDPSTPEASAKISLCEYIELPAKVTITSPSWTFCAALSAMTWSATVIFSRIKLSLPAAASSSTHFC
jgi:hypothetical protein